MANVGLIGIGAMGEPMAASLVRARIGAATASPGTLFIDMCHEAAGVDAAEKT